MNLTGLFSREWRALVRNRGAVLNPMAFLFLAVMLFAVGSPVSDNETARYGGAMLWLIVLLTNMLSLDSLFRRDFDNGVLEQVLSTAQAPFMVVLIRVLVQWLGTGLLITLLAPLLCLLLGLPSEAIFISMLALLLGTPALSLLGAVGAAMTVGFSRGGILLGLLVLPLFLPVLIFGASAINQTVLHMDATAPLAWLAFISMLALSVGPLAATLGLKISLQLQ
jgi:heme exporter protein B